MRTLRRLAWAAAVAGATATPAAAQQPAVSTTGGATATSSSGLGGLTPGTGGGSTGTGGTSSTGSNAGGNLGIQTIPQAPVISGLNLTGTTTTNSAINASNFFGPSFANPYYQGTLANQRANVAPGGFGTTLYPTTGGLGGGAAGGRGLGGAAGFGGTRPRATVGGVLVPIPRAIAYSAQVRFPTAAAAPVQIVTDIRGILDRTAALGNPAGVSVQADGRNVTLRGAVKDEDEARLVEGLVRLTPGVGAIANELTYPRP